MDDNKLSCFFVSHFGSPGSDVRIYSDLLLEEIIKPALGSSYDVLRGDQLNTSGRVDDNVIELINRSNLCIVDLTFENPNVYYEFGRIEAIEKPCILLKSIDSKELPADVSNCVCIGIDINNINANIRAREEIRNEVQQLAMSGGSRGVTLSTINEKIDRIEKETARFDRIEKEIVRLSSGSTASGKIVLSDELDEKEDPRILFRLAMMQRNIPLAEKAMEKLEYSMDKIQFYDYIVEQVAALGSRKAGEMLIEYADTFMDSVQDNQKQIEYLGCLVTYLNRTDQEQKYVDKIERIALSIKDSDNKVPGGVFNQLNRLHHGIYETTKDETHLDKAIDYLNKAIAANPDEASYYYNVATCYKAKAEGHDENDEFIRIACENVSKAVEMDGENYDDDHLSLACRLFYRINDPKWKDYLDLLEKVSPARAYIIKQDLQ